VRLTIVLQLRPGGSSTPNGIEAGDQRL